MDLTRRQMLAGTTPLLIGLAPFASTPRAESLTGLVLPVRDFGAVPGSRADSSRAIQAAVDEAARRGGGTVLIPGTYRCGRILLRGDGVTVLGQDGATLIGARIVVLPGVEGCRVEKLVLLDPSGSPEGYGLEVSGRHFTADGLTLVKNPIAGGYHAYLRAQSAFCTFTGLKTRGSNGLFVAGRGHRFTNFELDSPIGAHAGGDDAFAIKGAGSDTSDIEIRDGIVRGHSAIVSIGSEVGRSREHPHRGSVRGIRLSNVTGDRCAMVAFIKPGGLIYDWRDGLVEDVSIEQVRLDDPGGVRFTSGIRIIADRGSQVVGVRSRQVTVHARASSRGKLPTAGIDLSIGGNGGRSAIRNVDLQLSLIDPLAGAPHGPRRPGYPVDHAVRIEKARPGQGSIEQVAIDVDSNGTGFGGIYVGAGLDDAIFVRRARLAKVGSAPPSSLGGGGIWSDSRIRLGNVEMDVVSNARFGGRGFNRPR